MHCHYAMEPGWAHGHAKVDPGKCPDLDPRRNRTLNLLISVWLQFFLQSPSSPKPLNILACGQICRIAGRACGLARPPARAGAITSGSRSRHFPMSAASLLPFMRLDPSAPPLSTLPNNAALSFLFFTLVSLLAYHLPYARLLEAKHSKLLRVQFTNRVAAFVHAVAVVLLGSRVYLVLVLTLCLSS